MTESDEGRRFDELIAVLEAIHQDQRLLVEELRRLHEEIRSLREELGGSALRPRAPAIATPPALEERAGPIGPEPASVAPPPPPPPRAPGVLGRLAAALASSLAGTPRSLLERTPVLALVVGLLVAGASELNLLQPVEVLAEYPKEWVRADRSRREVVNQIVMVAIDDGSVDKLGKWGPAWRAHHGRVLRNLADDGAKAVGFDLFFKTPSDAYDPVFIEGIEYAKSKGLGVVVGMEYDPRQSRLLEPVSPIREVVSFSSTYLQKDRVTNLVRYVSLFQAAGADGEEAARLVPAFAVGMATAGGKRAEDIPRYRNGIVPIDFAGAASAFRTVPYLDVYEKRFPPGAFKNKYVLIGAYWVASRDFFDTPVQSEMPGVLIHANALYTLLRGVGRPLALPWRVGVIVAVAALTGGICSRFRRAPRAVFVVGFVLAYWGLAIGLGLATNPLSLDVVPATATIVLMWGGVAVREKMVAMRELRQSLGLPEEALRRLEQDRAFQQGTLAKQVTVLASDVKNYSVFSRNHPPTHVRAIMTEYQQMVERAIYRHGGYVNKFIGDAVIAIFGYPMDEEATALRCVRAAKETQEGLRALTDKWRRENREGIAEVRIGINTGVVNVSYLGSSKKQLDVMGANIDLAARLESAAGEFGCFALLGPETYEEVKGLVQSRTVPVKLKNRPDVTQAFTFDGLAGGPGVDTRGEKA